MNNLEKVCELLAGVDLPKNSKVINFREAWCKKWSKENDQMFEFNLISKAHYVAMKRDKYPEIFEQLKKVALS